MPGISNNNDNNNNSNNDIAGKVFKSEENEGTLTWGWTGWLAERIPDRFPQGGLTRRASSRRMAEAARPPNNRYMRSKWPPGRHPPSSFYNRSLLSPVHPLTANVPSSPVCPSVLFTLPAHALSLSLSLSLISLYPCPSLFLSHSDVLFLSSIWLNLQRTFPTFPASRKEHSTTRPSHVCFPKFFSFGTHASPQPTRRSGAYKTRKRKRERQREVKAEAA